jgi:hypothetical protein
VLQNAGALNDSCGKIAIIIEGIGMRLRVRCNQGHHARLLGYQS